MSDEKEAIQATDLPVTIHAQYVRDLSFENPNAPEALRTGLANPEMNVSINLTANPLEGTDIQNLYEVSLIISATAKREDQTLFIAEVVYGITVSISDIVPENQHHPVLFIEIPRLAFPFARQILITAVTQGGYPPLPLQPVDFQALYMERFKEELEESQAKSASGKSK